ncbi:MFS transporter [Calothrix sp. CCY 0018]|uniref:MFS transporter n=1 Tax=Calothrix sp. CCY 0018 TaxID=3103864 RepID=UPI0039C62CEB
MSAGDVSKNDRNNKTPMSEILKSDINKNREKKNKDQLYSHKGSKKKLEENSQAAAVKFAQKSDSSVENNQKNHEKNKVNTSQQGFLPVLTNTNFLALWGGQVFCQLADKVYLVLMIALINTQFQSEGSSISGWVSALMMTFTIPAVLFGSLAGVFVDRWMKKQVLVSTNIWRGILVLGIVPLLWLAKGWQDIGDIPAGFLMILAVTFLVSTLTQFFAPAEQAVIPLIVKPHNLLSANSLYTTTMMASVIVGFAIGEPLLSAADALWLQFGGSGELGKEILVGGSYIVAGLILMLLTTNEKPQEKEKASNHIFSDLKDGFVYLGKNHRLRNALIQLIILFSVLAALTVLAVRIAEVIPSITPDQFGFLLASGGVGIALGAILLGQFGQNFSTSRLSLAGSMGMAVSLAGLAIFTQQLWTVLSLIGFLGLSGALVGIPLQTAIQTETPTKMHGKVFGLQNNLVNIALTLPLALAGIAETFFGLQTVFLTLAAIVFFAGILTRYKSA